MGQLARKMPKSQGHGEKASYSNVMAQQPGRIIPGFSMYWEAQALAAGVFPGKGEWGG